MVDVTEEISLGKLTAAERRTVLKVLARMEANGIVRMGTDADGNITVKLLSQAATTPPSKTDQNDEWAAQAIRERNK